MILWNDIFLRSKEFFLYWKGASQAGGGGVYHLLTGWYSIMFLWLQAMVQIYSDLYVSNVEQR